MNIKHSKQVIATLSTPFILVHLQKLPGVTGERAEKSGSGFGVFTCRGWRELVLVLFLWEGSALNMSVFLIWNVWLNRKSKSRYWPRHFFGLYGNNAHCLPTKAAERKQRSWEDRHSNRAFQKHTVNSSHAQEPVKLNQTTGGDTLSKQKNPSSLLWDPKFFPLCYTASVTQETPLDVLHFKSCFYQIDFPTEFRNSNRKQQKIKGFNIVVNRFAQVSCFPNKEIASLVELYSSSKDLRRLSVSLGHLGGWVVHAKQCFHWLIIKGQGIWVVWEVTFHTGSWLFSFAFSSVHYSALQGKATAFIWHRWQVIS